MNTRIKAALAAAGIVALATVCLIRTNNHADDLFEKNVEALAKTENAVYGYCRKEENACVFFCPTCNAALISVPDLKGPSYKVSGTCPNCHNTI